MSRPAAAWARRALGPGLARLGIRFFDFYFGVRRMDDVPPAVEPRVPTRVRPAPPAELERLAPELAAEVATDVRRAIAAGSECVVAECDGRIAGFMWVNLARIDVEGEPVCRLPAGAAYVHTTYVAPEMRGKKLLQVMARNLHGRLRDRGCAFTCRLVDRENAASIEGTARGGIRWQWAPVVKLPGRRPFFALGRPAALRERTGSRAVTAPR